MPHEEFEKTIMNMLLAGEDETLKILRKQYEESKVISRDFTGCGFFTYFDVPETLVQETFEGRIDDVGAKLIEGDVDWLFFILYIENGKFDVLEAFTTGDGWNGNYNADTQYLNQGKRTFEMNGNEVTLKIG